MPPAPGPSEKDLDGFWGKPTSTLDWCEENYVVSPYIAEFWNTISNLAFILPPVMFMAYFSKYHQIEARYYVVCLLVLLVGIGSWCFHMTLLFEMQMLDELPMIYAACVLLYCIFQTEGKKQESNLLMVFALSLYAIGVTIIYLTIKDPIFHEVCYGITVLLTFGRAAYFLRALGHSKYLYLYSFVCMLGAFFIWNFDNISCAKIRSWRDGLPFPLSLLTQGHMWWHLVSALGVYVFIMYSLHSRSTYLNYAPKIKHVASFPYISHDTVTTKKQEVDGNKNHYQ